MDMFIKNINHSKASKIIIAIYCVILLTSFQNKNVSLQPFQFLITSTNLSIKQGWKSGETENLSKEEINSLSNLTFESSGFKVEEIGVTPDYSISIFQAEKRICLIGIWVINQNKFAVNINQLEKEVFHYGYVIEQNKLEKVLKFKRRNNN